MRLLFAIVALMGLIVSFPVMAGDKEIAAIKAVLGPEPDLSALFSPDFLQQVPSAQLAPTLQKVRQQIGAVTSVTHDTGNSYTVETATHDLPVDIVLNADGRIAGLLFRSPTARNASLDDLLAEMKSLAPQTAILITRNGEEMQASNAETPLAVGSAFKLGILKALKDEVAAGARKWSDVVTLGQRDMSLPSGMLQAWPVGSPVTLHTLASLMISVSDNTATDTLLHLLGREKVEAVLGIAPVLSTRELFTLKSDEALRTRYLGADAAGKLAILSELDGLPLPDASKVTGPFVPGIEYDLSPSKLCALIGDVADLDVFMINPGVARPADWQAVAYKGGSEPGVLNMTTRVVARDGTTYCLSATWNAPSDVDAAKAQAAYGSVLAQLAKGRN